MYPFRKLSVWRRAHALALSVHEVTERNDRGRHVSLIGQTRKASCSIAATIVTGSAQPTSPQFAAYLTTALTSARQLDYHVLLARDLGVIPLADYTRLEARIDQVCRMLAVLRKRVLESSGHSRRVRRIQVSPPSDHLLPYD